MNFKVLNRDAVKYLAIIAMTFNHIAHALLTPGTAIFELFENIGYFTAITMCFFLVEGYQYTRSKKSYAIRLFIFAMISQIPYMSMIGFFQFNIFFTLLLCFLILCIWESKQPEAGKILEIIFLTGCSIMFDWGLILPLATVLFIWSKGRRNFQILSYAILILLFGLLNALGYGQNAAFSWADVFFHSALSTSGIFVSAITLLFLYNGKRAEHFQKFHQCFFYLYYPLHLTVLAILRKI